MNGLKIAEAAEILGVHPETLRRWERRGVLPPAKRSPLGWRIYSGEDLKELRDRIEPKQPALV